MVVVEWEVDAKDVVIVLMNVDIDEDRFLDVWSMKTMSTRSHMSTRTNEAYLAPNISYIRPRHIN